MFTHDLTTEPCLLHATKANCELKHTGDHKAKAYCGMFIAGYVVFKWFCVRAQMSKHCYVDFCSRCVITAWDANDARDGHLSAATSVDVALDEKAR